MENGRAAGAGCGTENGLREGSRPFALEVDDAPLLIGPHYALTISLPLSIFVFLREIKRLAFAFGSPPDWCANRAALRSDWP
jgi:hypothetical protein